MLRVAIPLLVLSGCAVAPPEAVRTNSLGMEMVRVLPGEFLMGSSTEEAERVAALMKEKKITSWYPDSPASEAPPRRTRITKALYLARHETTVGQFRAFVEATGYRTEAEKDGKGADGKVNGKWTTRPEFNWRDMGYARTDDFPVVNVTWADAAAFCAWLSRKEGRAYRLPTEAEWEYACRAGASTRFHWGDDESVRNEYAWTGANSGGGPHPVGKLKPNAWGFHDMLGNVYEYCSDYFVVKPYDPAQAVDPKGPAEGKERVVRSVSWGTNPMHARCAFRGGAGPGHRNMRDGFRVACDAE
jgi:formylglycine-generating enzyme required for sulfatase activity